MSYNFNPEETFNIIERDIKAWATKTNTKRFVLGISGGKDSTVVAMLLSVIFGNNNIDGVMLPCGEQSDISDSEDVIRILGITRHILNIGESFNAIMDQIHDASYDTKTNLPARLRMAALFAIGQTTNAKMINTCNLSEDMVGYATLYGDCSGCYAPIQGLTVTEIRQLGKWVLDYKMMLTAENRARLLELIDKVPVDGLQPLTDEDKLGFTYESLDRFIRLDEGSDEFKDKIAAIYKKNLFKLEIVRLPQPVFTYPNFVRSHAMRTK